MRIISHRGFWTGPEEKNTMAAFRRSAARGFGTETDIRDLAGALVIAHDPPRGGELSLAETIDVFAPANLPLALNIKADGLAAMVAECCAARGFANWFAFDMSVPEQIRYRHLGLPYFTRHSDAEPHPTCYDQAKGVWLDAFFGDWYGWNTIATHLGAGKTVCVVSPELHGRPHAEQWRMLRDEGAAGAEELILCTDLPDEARHFFGEQAG